ncbi:MAG: phosphotransferase [Bacteroidetes bacterium]|nr:phosphotransferase [Bacteroidota bacterium]
MIPENKQLAVKKALQTAFGVNEFEDIQQLVKGLSGSLVSKITVRGNPYVLRIVTRQDSRDSPTHYFDCMRSGAEAGLAPKIHYLDTEDKISIIDFIKEKPFAIADAKEKMADVIKRLHTLPKFPNRTNYVDAADGFLQKFKASDILPENATKDIFESYARIANVYPRNDKENWVSCHNDLKRDNIIFDGARPWLVDWEAAFLNDRYMDLAAMANFIVRSEKDEAEFLDRYFGRAADEYERARFFLMSQIIHMFCFTLCMVTAAGGKPVDVSNINKPGFNAFHDSLWNAEIDLGKSEAKLEYAWAHIEEYARKMQMKRFEDSLSIVSRHIK